MFSGLSEALADVPSRCQNTAAGLGDSLRFAGTGTQTPVWDILHTLAMPVLLIAGAKDQKFVDLASRMKSLIPNSELHVIDDVGHTCHLEDIAGFTAIFHDWLSRI
jgi:2-succinyl-6-hydroxy-2,4-cyclohexadiene-1-carboxylate synthase